LGRILPGIIGLLLSNDVLLIKFCVFLLYRSSSKAAEGHTCSAHQDFLFWLHATKPYKLVFH
jgi:hypothetical protein